MDDQYTPVISEEERAARRAQRAEQRRKKQQARRRRQLMQFLPVAGFALVLVIVLAAWGGHHQEEPEPVPEEPIPQAAPAVSLPEEPEPPYAAVQTPDTVHLDDTFPSACAVVIDLGKSTILAEKSSDAIISPTTLQSLT